LAVVGSALAARPSPAVFPVVKARSQVTDASERNAEPATTNAAPRT